MIELHSQNIIHYDLIPKNILINQEKQVKIANISTLNSIRYRCKSKIFSAPEIGTQKNDNINNRKAIDVYAFGVNLCYIVSKGRKITIPNIENFQIPEKITQKAKNIILKCLSHEPEKRPSFESILNEINTDGFALFS